MTEPPEPPDSPDDPEGTPHRPRPENRPPNEQGPHEQGGQPPYEQQGGQPPYEQGPYEQGQYGQPPYQQAPYEQGPYGQPTYPPAQAPYGQPGYPAPDYPGYPQPPAPAGPGLVARLGARVERRPEARFSISVAGAGAVLAIIGGLIWSFGYFGDGFHLDFNDSGSPRTSGEGRRFLGAGVFLVLTAAGYLLAFVKQRGPLATAGAVASAVGFPIILIFLTLDFEDVFRGDYPFNFDLVTLLSILVWLVGYFAVPGLRGRAFLLGLAALNLASYIAVKAAGDAFLRTAGNIYGGAGPSLPDTDSAGAVGLAFGLAYYAIAVLLDKRGKPGPAIALVYAGFFVTVFGIALLANSFEEAGTGVVLILVGLGLAYYGGYFGRRFTTWAWSAGFVLGIFLVLDKILDADQYTAAGITLLVLGALVVAGAHVVSVVTHEAPDVEEAVAQRG